MKIIRIIPVFLLILSMLGLSGCSKQERTIAGILIGAGTGALIGSAVGGTGGGVAGAAIGGITGGVIGNASGHDNGK